jgi:hypothetical protein
VSLRENLVIFVSRSTLDDPGETNAVHALFSIWFSHERANTSKDQNIHPSSFAMP